MENCLLICVQLNHYDVRTRVTDICQSTWRYQTKLLDSESLHNLLLTTEKGKLHKMSKINTRQKGPTVRCQSGSVRVFAGRLLSIEGDLTSFHQFISGSQLQVAAQFSFGNPLFFTADYRCSTNFYHHIVIIFIHAQQKVSPKRPPNCVHTIQLFFFGSHSGAKVQML